MSCSGVEDLVPRGDEPQGDETEDDPAQDAELCPGDALEQVLRPQGGGDAQPEGDERAPAVGGEDGPQDESDGPERQREQRDALPGRLQQPVPKVRLPGQLVRQPADEADGDDEPDGSTDVHDFLLPGG